MRHIRSRAERDFFVFREVINNIEKHARATRVNVTLVWGQCELRIIIQDNGVGFVSRVIDSSHHFGFNIIRERLAGLNGSVALDSARNSGTRVTILIPPQ